jgi:hypothetical protein
MDNQKQYSLLVEAFNAVYDNISESHFKVGDEVVCKKSGMEGEVVKLDKPDGKEDEKYYTVKREDGKKVKYSPNELKLAEEAKNGGVPKKKEEKFHTKLDKLVHSTFGSSPEEEKMKEEFNRVEEGYKSPNKERIERQVGKAYKTERSALNRGDADEAMRQNRRRNAMNSPSTRRNELESKNRKEEVEFDIFDVILEHLVAEGYADTNQAALAIMANMSEEWKQDIIEAAKDQSNKQIEKGVKTTYKAGNVIDNQHQGRSKGLNKLPASERKAKTERMQGRLKARRDDLFGERNRREDEARAEMKKKYGL